MSIIIVKNEHGYIASLRFSDPKLNEEVSATNWHTIHAKVENIVLRKGVY
jgi:hypothetical protein